MRRAIFAIVILFASTLTACSDVKIEAVSVRSVHRPSPWSAELADGVKWINTARWGDVSRWNDVTRWSAEVERAAVTVPHPSPKPRARSHTSSPSNSVEACIIARENGGSYGRSSNPTHFGAFQFDRQTWAANGGDPATWGSASPAEQDAVFRATVARYGYAPWRPYDGC